MSRPMSIDFAVAVPDATAGEAFAERATLAGFSIKLDQDEPSGEWTCYCTKTMRATYEGVVAVQSELDLLARPFGGYSDGWATFGNRK